MAICTQFGTQSRGEIDQGSVFRADTGNFDLYVLDRSGYLALGQIAVLDGIGTASFQFGDTDATSASSAVAISVLAWVRSNSVIASETISVGFSCGRELWAKSGDSIVMGLGISFLRFYYQ